jgi:hypothetical protein
MRRDPDTSSPAIVDFAIQWQGGAQQHRHVAGKVDGELRHVAG